MKNVIIILFAGLAIAMSSAAEAEKIDRTLDVQEQGRVDIDVMDGSIIIKGWDKPQVRVVGDVPINEHNFTFKTKGDRTKIEHSGEHGFWNRSRSGSYAKLTIYAPRNSNFRVDGTSTGYELHNIAGQVRVNTMSGDIELDGGTGSVELESVSGDVIVKGASGRLNLSSVSGDIEASGKAQQFDAQTVSGSIRAKIGKSNDIKLESISGDIEIQLELDEDARLLAGTVSGDIDVSFDSDAINASFDIETGPGGEIENKISNHKTQSNFSFSGSMRFTLGNGDSTVNLETMSGTIEIDQ